MAVSFAGGSLIYMIFNCLCYWRRFKHNDDCCNSECYFVNRIMYASFALCMAVGMLSVESILFAHQVGKYNSLLEWAEFSPCVDAYMQVSDYQVSDLKYHRGLAIRMLVFTLVITIVSLFNFTSVICFCCSRRFNKQ